MNGAQRILEELSVRFVSDDDVLREPVPLDSKRRHGALVGSRQADDGVRLLLETYPSSLTREGILAIARPDPASQAAAKVDTNELRFSLK